MQLSFILKRAPVKKKLILILAKFESFEKNPLTEIFDVMSPFY
jgi:hypothetical protein